jgi:hypothetical protein
MKDYITILDYFYLNTDLVCICTIPDFAGRKQRFCKVAELKTEKWQRFLRAANANNSNIYLSVYTFTKTERTENNVVDAVDRIFLDFDTPGSYEVFRKEFEPTIVINTSPNKFQCFLKLSEPVNKAEAKAISKTLARLYNADHTFDLARVFRLPGFRNVKYPERPLATISEFNPQTTYSPYNLPCEKEKEKELSKSPASQQGEKKDISNIKSPQNNSTATFSVSPSQYDYSHFLNSVPMKQKKDEKDYSLADWKYAVHLLGHGNDAQAVSE